MITDPKCYDSRSKTCRFWIPRFSSCVALNETYVKDGDCPFFKPLDGFEEASDVDARKDMVEEVSPIQAAIDSYLLRKKPQSVSDMEFIPEDNVVIVRRKKTGQRSLLISVEGCNTPTEAMDRILRNPIFQ